MAEEQGCNLEEEEAEGQRHSKRHLQESSASEIDTDDMDTFPRELWCIQLDALAPDRESTSFASQLGQILYDPGDPHGLANKSSALSSTLRAGQYTNGMNYRDDVNLGYDVCSIVMPSLSCNTILGGQHTTVAAACLSWDEAARMYCKVSRRNKSTDLKRDSEY
nr:hypothetical protein CFP56_69873 [Quercus suber]